ncbi:hypothetical protein ABE893_11215 [Enterococcus entomosocium]|uniref:hypothetical protein n=1 Tax=Enterococcus entomosocium TaxID=3034352 RepID=UPI003D6B7BBA
MFLNSAGIDREELLELIVYEYVYAKTTYGNTLLGKPPEVIYAEGKMMGVCISLGLNYEIKNKIVTFKLNSTNKEVARFTFDPEDPW